LVPLRSMMQVGRFSRTCDISEGDAMARPKLLGLGDGRSVDGLDGGAGGELSTAEHIAA
jgi:hypothetical protein